MAGLANDAGSCVDRVIEQIAGPLVERINAGQHALYIAFRQNRVRKRRPACVRGISQLINFPIADGDVIVTERLNPAASPKREMRDVRCYRGKGGPSTGVSDW